MHTNLYGPNDNFDDTSSHVIPGLMQRLHKAKISQDKLFKVWGSGKPKREFLFVDDLSKAITFLIDNEIDSGILNIGSGVEVTISELVDLLIKVVGFEGNLEFDTTMPDGNPRKLIDSKKINDLGWSHKTDLENGLKITYEWYKSNIT
jgi:GDP-L-fucose synthase